MWVSTYLFKDGRQFARFYDYTLLLHVLAVRETHVPLSGYMLRPGSPGDAAGDHGASQFGHQGNH